MVTSERLTARLAVIAKPDYVEALRALIRLGKATCTQIARLFDWKEPRMWKYLERLRNAGLVERQGCHAGTIWTPRLDEIRALFAVAAAYICQNGEAPS